MVFIFLFGYFLFLFRAYEMGRQLVNILHVSLIN